uniref:Putative ovule protein n=1 Tax=Solanum chacoense TaxID=4108 RepID=A0A0V0H1X8_SOLCH
MYLPPSPAITAHPPLFMLKSCLCLSRLSFACYSLRPEKEPPLGFISSLEFLFRILVYEVRTRALMQFKLTSSSDSIINVRRTEQNL